MADKVYTVLRALIAANMSGVSHVVGTYTDESVAAKAVKELEQDFISKLQLQLCQQSPAGLVPVGISLGQVFQQCGIVSMKAMYFGTEPKGAILVAPPPPLIKLQ